MIRGIVRTCLTFRYLVLALAIVLMVYGFFTLRKMPVDILPEFNPPIVEIQTEALGLSATEVESLVTMNVEELVNGTPWLESIHSESIPGLSSIILRFKPGTDFMRARQLVQEKLLGAYALPNISKAPIMLQHVSATRRLMIIGLSSNTVSPIQLSVLAQWTIKPKLMGIDGVANVVIWGQKSRQLQVLMDPNLMKAHNLTQDQIIRTTGDSLWYSQLSYLEASAPSTGGWIETPNQRIGIRHVLPISSAEDLAKLPIYDAPTLRLGDVTKVVESYPQLIGDAYLGNEPGIILVIEKFPWSNAVEVTKKVENTLKDMKAGLPGVKIDTQIFQLSRYIDISMSNLTTAIIISAILIAITLFLLLFDWRATLISFLAIPLSILTASIILYLLGASINIMVLTGFGIALGAIVDDSIVDLEYIINRLRTRNNNDPQSIFSIILESSLQVRRSIIFATLIIVLAVSPIFFLGSVTGAFFKPLAFSYALALICSMIVAFTVTPALAYLLFQNYTRQEAIILSKMKLNYEKVLSKSLESTRVIYSIAVILFIIGLLGLCFTTFSYLPDFKEHDVVVEVDGIPGMSQPEMTRLIKNISEDIREVPGIKNIGGLVGRAITSDKVTNINSGQIWVNMDPSADYNVIMNKIDQIIASYPGVDFDIQKYLKNKIQTALTGENEDIVIRINGPKLETLQDLGEEVRQALSKIDGITDLRVEGQLNEPQIEIKVDIQKATPLGIKPGDVRRAAATIFAGIQAGSLYESQKVFDVVVWSIPEARHSLTNLKDLLIDKPGGGYVRLGDIASVEIVPTPTGISHIAISPYIDIVANVKNRSYGSVIKDVETALSNIDFPLEYHPKLLGEYSEKQTIKKDLLIVGLIVLVVIYFLLQACFENWRLAFLAFLALPTALIGGILASLLSGGLISIGSLVGFLAIFGIAVRNGILLINHIKYLECEERVTFGSSLVLRGTIERFSPILLTALTTFAALLPFIFMGNVAGLEMIHPMAVVMMGGLITSTLLNLLVIPPLYLAFGKNCPVSEGKKNRE